MDFPESLNERPEGLGENEHDVYHGRPWTRIRLRRRVSHCLATFFCPSTSTFVQCQCPVTCWFRQGLLVLARNGSSNRNASMGCCWCYTLNPSLYSYLTPPALTLETMLASRAEKIVIFERIEEARERR